MEFDDRPALRRFGGLLAGSSFAEGWGLYSERLADEMGLYLDDWERLGMLAAQAHRAARLITDTGIHAFGWSREDAIEKLVAGGSPRGESEVEVDRYIALPAQALAYMVGMVEIEDARRRDRREGGRRVRPQRLPRPPPRARTAPAAGAPSRAGVTQAGLRARSRR